MAVTNTDSDNPRKEVQVSVSLVIKEPLPVALVEQQRLGKEGGPHRGKVLLVDLQDAAVGEGLRAEDSSVSEPFLSSSPRCSPQQVPRATRRLSAGPG